MDFRDFLSLAIDLAKGTTEAPQAQRKYLLEVEGRISAGSLQVRFRYSRDVHRETTIESLTQFFRSALCTDLQNHDEPAVPAHDPSDFPLADLSRQDLDYLLRELSETEA